jgi:integrase
MATYRKRGRNWQVIIRRLGFAPISRGGFHTKLQAQEWAVPIERDLLAGRYNPNQHTLTEALDRYAREISPKKGGARWELLRIAVFQRSTMAAKPLSRLTEDDISRWREDRLQAVSGATVRREMNLWQSVLEVARKEWKWIDRNPVVDVKKPPSPRSRQRGVRQAEIDTLAPHFTAAGMREVFDGFLLGIETAMRAGEMWSLERPQIDLERSVAHLTKTKNGDTREVPLSPRAVEIIQALLADGREVLFSVPKASRDTLFRKGRQAAGILDLHFHDSRSEGVSRLSKTFDVLELARVVGHRDIRSLMHYYRTDAADLAKRLAAGRSPTRRPRATAGKSRARKGG